MKTINPRTALPAKMASFFSNEEYNYVFTVHLWTRITCKPYTCELELRVNRTLVD